MCECQKKTRGAEGGVGGRLGDDTSSDTARWSGTAGGGIIPPGSSAPPAVGHPNAWVTVAIFALLAFVLLVDID